VLLIHQNLGTLLEKRMDIINTTNDFVKDDHFIEKVSRKMSEEDAKTEKPMKPTRNFKKSLHLYKESNIPSITKSSTFRKQYEERKNCKNNKIKSEILDCKEIITNAKSKVTIFIFI
jgi:hypothetical protein